VAAGEHGHGGEVAAVDHEDLPFGSVAVHNGRVSAATVYVDEPPSTQVPFTPVQMSRLDEALTLTSRDTGLRFSIYLGDLGEEPVAKVAELHGSLEQPSESVLVAVSPEKRHVEVFTGPEARLRLPDRGAKLAVMSMVASFKEGQLFEGLLSGLRMLADQAGPRPRQHPVAPHH
jgi:hypothetical protein